MRRSEKIKLLQDLIAKEESLDLDEEVDARVVISDEAVPPIFSDGWYDKDSGSVIYDKITDETVREAIRDLTEKYTRREAEAAVSDELVKVLSEYNTTVTPDKILKLVDRDSIQYSDGKVTGAVEAVEKVAEDYPTLLAKKKSNTPADEGFNPSSDGNKLKVKDLRFN